ncbi:MAG: GxxExxY protein [Chitinophagaceae bacterium]|nr:GxxExxY protein [Chitinophagaceae bacterium]
MVDNEITSIIIEESIYVHRNVGPGLFESVYEELLSFRLIKRGLKIERQRAVPVIFEEVIMDIGFRADLIMENKVLVEIKSVESLANIASVQTLTYLRFSGISIGLLINFNVEKLKDGIKRIANNYIEGT